MADELDDEPKAAPKRKRSSKGAGDSVAVRVFRSDGTPVTLTGEVVGVHEGNRLDVRIPWGKGSTVLRSLRRGNGDGDGSHWTDA